MNPAEKIRILVVVVAVLAVLAAAVWITYQFDQSARQSEQHALEYSFTFWTNTTLFNVTMLLPAPERNGTPYLVQSLVKGTGYGVPPDWNLTIERQNGTQMLRISADRIVPHYRGYPLPIVEGESPSPTISQSGTEYPELPPVIVPITIVATESRNDTINTRDPIGHEPVFAQEGTFVPGPVTAPVSGEVAYSHNVPFFVRYRSEGPANLSFLMRIEGVNSIWRGGWTFNMYSDDALLEVPAGTQGWIEAGATLIAGEGIYY